MTEDEKKIYLWDILKWYKNNLDECLRSSTDFDFGYRKNQYEALQWGIATLEKDIIPPQITKEKALFRLKAMRKCLDCNIDAEYKNCDECENNYRVGTMSEVLETYDFIIKTLEGAE